MLWVTLFIALVISLAVILYVIRPLIDSNPAPVFVEDDRLTDLLSRKDVVLRGIKDLEFDRSVGKLEEADFVRFNQSLSRQAVSLMQQIEKIAPTSNQLDDVLEQEIAVLRKTKDGSVAVKVVPSRNRHDGVQHDGVQHGDVQHGDVQHGDVQHDDMLEQEIAGLRKTKTRATQTRTTAVHGAPIKKIVASSNGDSPATVEDKLEDKPKFCTECGQPISANHKFCANCGVALT